jgi:hypothetical protein
VRPLVVASIALAACGGKIAPDPYATSTPSSYAAAPPPPAQPPSAQEESAAAPPPSVDAACSTVCDHQAACGAYRDGCVDRCIGEARSSCARVAIAFTMCWAATVDPGCGELAPECEPAYCAYAACEGAPSAPYCP